MTDIQTVATEPRTLKSLFNAKSMALKYVRDFAVVTTAFVLPIAFHKSGAPDLFEWGNLALPLAMVSGMTAAIATAGRYAGGAVGTGIDTLINKARGKQPLEKSYLRKPLAGAFGIATGGAVYLSLAMMGGLFGNLNVTEAQPDQTQRVVVADASKPQAKLG